MQDPDFASVSVPISITAAGSLSGRGKAVVVVVVVGWMFSIPSQESDRDFSCCDELLFWPRWAIVIPSSPRWEELLECRKEVSMSKRIGLMEHCSSHVFDWSRLFGDKRISLSELWEAARIIGGIWLKEFFFCWSIALCLNAWSIHWNDKRSMSSTVPH